MKNKEIFFTILLLTVFTISFWRPTATLATLSEPAKPIVDRSFDVQKETEIIELQNLTIANVFQRLKGTKYLINKDFLHKAIFTAFEFRREEAIAYAQSKLRIPIKEKIAGELINRSDTFYVAKVVMEVFPEESVGSLLELYGKSDEITKANILQASGNIAGGEAIKNLLIGALDDNTICEAKDSGMEGEPLRLKDVAYNQLVLRYKIKNVLRAISPMLSLGERNYHIDILKDLF